MGPGVLSFLLSRKLPIMPERNLTDWASTLASVEASIRGCLEELDQYEARFAQILEPDGTPTPAEHGATPRATPTDTRTDTPPDGWEARITQANEHTHAIEQILRGHQESWSLWRESFTTWQQSLQQPPGNPLPG